MKRPAIYGNKTIRLALEFGLVFSEVAKERNVKMTPELTERAEKVFINEIRTNGLKSTACQFVPLILACFET
jgi:hypothetical protein